jgi:NADPH:quinone reductase-like Zn-dependent oxidoreductase
MVRIHEFGGPEVLRLDEVPLPVPGSGEVRIRVAAIGLNRVEAIYREGQFGPVTLPATLGYEAAGVIEAIGAEVTGFAAGDRVAVLYGLSMERYGTYGEHIVYPADRLVRVPSSQSLVDAAASWMQYGTAYALVGIAQVKAGDHAVITAASSSVGIAAIQIARSHGAVPIAVTRDDAKADRLRELGAAHVIVSNREAVAERVREITGGQGARIAFDAVGGNQLGDLLTALGSEGIAIVYGMLGGYSTEFALPPMMMANLTLRGWAADIQTATAEGRAALNAYVAPRLASGELRPVIARTFALDEIAEAHRYLESNVQVGKVVVTTGSGDI